MFSAVTWQYLEIPSLRDSPICPLQYLCAGHIDVGKIMLEEQWYGEIHTTLLRASKRNQIPDIRRMTLVKRFFNCVAALMTQQLEDICIRSLKAFADYVCDYGVIRLI